MQKRRAATLARSGDVMVIRQKPLGERHLIAVVNLKRRIPAKNLTFVKA
jgi:hypothetical protein